MTNEPHAVALIAALSENRVIGRAGGLPWHLPADLRHFKITTLGHPLIMGRRTYASLGRPLPGRETIVLTRDPAFDEQGVVVAHTIEEALASARRAPGGASEIFIAGGAEVYRSALPLADRLYLTIVHAHVDGDTFFPAYDPRDWRCVDETRHEADDRHAFALSFRRYERCRRCVLG